MDDEEFHAVYFSVEERTAMRQDVYDLVRTIDEGLHIRDDEEVFDTRGLMSHTKSNLRRSRELRAALYSSILAAQRSGDDGWGNQEDSCDYIAKLSRNVTAVLKGKALATARQDAQEVLTKEDFFCSTHGYLTQDTASHQSAYVLKEASGQPPRRSSCSSDLQATPMHLVMRRIMKSISVQGRFA